MEILIFLIVSYFILCFTLMPLFERAGVEKNKAWIPGINFAEWARLIGRRKRYALWLLFPVVNLFIFTGMAVDLTRSFGKLKFWHTALSVIYAPLMFWLIGRDESAKYAGPILKMEAEYFAKIEQAEKTGKKLQLKKLHENNPYKKGWGREWVEAIVFAVFAAAFIRMFLIEAYNIPTPSMEGSLNVGDFLFVSKAHYGVRTPKTVAMIPLLHNRIPFSNKESYLEEPDLPYTRLPALENIDRDDIIVFNYPEGDSVYVFPTRVWSKYDYERGHMNDVFNIPIRNGSNPLVTRPIDKRDHYVKRAVAVPGDTIEIRRGQLYINGEMDQNPENIQFRYRVYYPTTPISREQYLDWGLSPEDANQNRFSREQRINIPNGGTLEYLVLNQAEIDRIKAARPDVEISRTFNVKVAFRDEEAMKNMNQRYGLKPGNYLAPVDNARTHLLRVDETQLDRLEADSSSIVKPYFADGYKNYVFPHDPDNYQWTEDDFGPLWIPKAGATVTLTPENIALYRDIINRYEHNDIVQRGDQFLINGETTNQYTFKQDYYWAMGDNRHMSEDSRYFGFVPADHIVGKPLFVWFSTKFGNIRNGVNWNRMFRPVSSLAK